MNEDLIGSPSRDLFKQKHKGLGAGFWACDLDFVLVEKYPFPDIVAAIDYKTESDSIGFSEVIVYNALLVRGIDTYIVQGDAETGQFEISKYVGGHHRKPTSHCVEVAATENWRQFGEWEMSLRNDWKTRFTP